MSFRRLFWPSLALLAFLYANSLPYPPLRRATDIGIWLAGAWLLNEVLHVAAWERFSRPVPALLKHLVAMTIFGLALTGILSFVFGQSVTGIWATSGIVGLVFGFAARSLISDLFSGIAMHLDPPFHIGDWIEWREGNEEILARVEQINWRSTRVHARDDTKTIFIPNGHLATMAVTNVFAPHGRTRQIIRIPLDPTVDLDRALRVILAGALAAEGPLPQPAPDVLIEGITTEGLIFLVRYWHDPDISIARVRSTVLQSVLRSLSSAGIKPARNRHEVVHAPLETQIAPGAFDVLSRADLFTAFEVHELNAIAHAAIRHEFLEGQAVVEQGAPGDSLYVVAEGLLEVSIRNTDEQGQIVGRLRAGDYFGEMSLLTGAPRSATIEAATSVVVFEVSKAVLEPILAKRPSVARHLAQTVATRQSANQAKLNRAEQTNPNGQQLSFTEQLLGKIRNFFSSPTPVS